MLGGTLMTMKSLVLAEKPSVGRELARVLGCKKRAEGWKNIGLLHVFLAAYTRVVATRPAINRFVNGQRIYARNNVEIVMAVKRTLTDAGSETTIKVELTPQDTIFDIYRKLNMKVDEIKADDGNNNTEQVAETLLLHTDLSKEDRYWCAVNALDEVENKIRDLQPDVAVIDSIQTMYRPEMASAPGSVSQIRESTSLIMRLCKETGTSIFLVGHVTKDGAIAGPRMLEHMVDVVLYFEGDRQQDYRLLRAVKNRFGSVNELGVFRMTGKGMQTVENPSEELLSHRAKGASGSAVFCGLEGSRPLLCDVQALTSPTYFGTPRRTVNGADAGRVALLLAVLEKRASQRTYNQDVYVNVAGGLELSEPAADLALCVAVASSLKDRTLSPEVAVMGEVGLAGEVRTIPQCERRISECARRDRSPVQRPADSRPGGGYPDRRGHGCPDPERSILKRSFFKQKAK